MLCQHWKSTRQLGQLESDINLRQVNVKVNTKRNWEWWIRSIPQSILQFLKCLVKQTWLHCLMRLQVWLLKSGCIDIVHLSFYQKLDIVRCNPHIKNQHDRVPMKSSLNEFRPGWQISEIFVGGEPHMRDGCLQRYLQELWLCLKPLNIFITI